VVGDDDPRNATQTATDAALAHVGLDLAPTTGHGVG
jgi:hypothetical protein